MIRYAKQRDRYSCGPTAMVNALKWAGHSAPYRKFRKRFIARCDSGADGTLPEQLNDALKMTKELDVKKVVNNPTLTDLNDQLRRERALILRFGHSWGAGHYILCVKETNKFYKVVNLCANGFGDKTVSYLSKKKMRNMLRRSREYIGVRVFSVMWSLEG